MPSWNSRGLRGSGLEELINLTIEKYRDRKLAVIQKIPTPITPVQMDSATRHITLAYFDQKSTVDYIGAVQGLPVCFDAKECQVDTFTLNNIHEHQMQFMEDFENQGGIAFFLIKYTKKDILYYMRYREIKVYWERMTAGGRKSFRFDELDDKWFFQENKGVFIPFLPMIQKDLDEREESTENN